MKKNIFIIIFLFINVLFYAQINTFYWLNSGRDKILKNENLPAIECFNVVIKFLPESDEAYFLRAVAKYNLSDYRGALDDFSMAIKNNTYSSNYYLYRGDTKERLYDFKGARDDYNKSLDFNPDNVMAYICRGVNSIHLKNYDEALVDFSNAVKLNSRNHNAFLFRALGKQFKGKFEDALIDYDKAIDLDPKNADAYIKRGRNFFEMKEFKKAIADFDKAIDIEPRNSYAFFNRAIAKSESFDYMGALCDYNQVVAFDPENALTYFNRALLRVKINSPDSAILDFDKVLEISPQNVITYFNRGVVWDKLKKPKKALIDFSKAIALNPNFSAAYYYRSIQRRNLKDFYGAEQDYQKAAQLNAVSLNDSVSTTIDSLSMARMLEFKADFEESNEQIAKINELGISRFSNCLIHFDVENTKDEKSKIFKDLDALINENYFTQGKIYLSFAMLTSSRDSFHQFESIISGIEPFTKDIDQLIKRATLKSLSKNYMGAIDDFNQIIELFPDKSLSYFGRANTRFELISIINSIREFNNEIVVGSDLNKIKTIDNRKKEKLSYDEAIEDYKKAISTDPAFFPAYYNLANVLIDAGDYLGAIRNYSSAIDIQPQFAQAYFNRGLTFIYLKETEKGCLDISKAGELGVEEAYPVIKKYCGK